MVHILNIVSSVDYGIGSIPLDGDISHRVVIDKTPDGGALIGGFESGRPVKAELMPTKMRWEGGNVEMPDFDRHHCINVSERAKALVEKFEPDVHQFIPVDYYHGTGEVKERRYFLIVGNRIDSLDHDKTTFVLRHIITTTEIEVNRWVPIVDLVRWKEQHLIPPHLSSETKSKLIFSLTKIGKTHLWRDKFLGGANGPWLSDNLADALTEAGMTGIKLPHKVEAIL